MSALRIRIAKVLARQLHGPTWDDNENWDNPTHSQQVFLADADAVIRELGWQQESCVRYTYAPRFTSRGLDACDDCGEPG